MLNFGENTPLAMLTVGQFKEIIISAMPRQEVETKLDASPLDIPLLFKVSTTHTVHIVDTKYFKGTSRVEKIPLVKDFQQPRYSFYLFKLSILFRAVSAH